MTTETKYLGNLKTEVTHIQSGTKISTSAPKDNNGDGSSFSPTDLLATSLCSCMFTIMGIAARTHGFDIDGASATMTKIMSASPRRVSEIIIEITFPKNNYSDKDKLILQKAVKECPVAKSLHPDIKQNVKLIF